MTIEVQPPPKHVLISNYGITHRWRSPAPLELIRKAADRRENAGRERQHFDRGTPQWCGAKSTVSLAAPDVGGSGLGFVWRRRRHKQTRRAQTEERNRELERLRSAKRQSHPRRCLKNLIQSPELDATKRALPEIGETVDNLKVADFIAPAAIDAVQGIDWFDQDSRGFWHTTTSRPLAMGSFFV